MHTLEEVQGALKSAVERFPNRRNPFSDTEGTCLNTGPKGAHCIAAQVYVDLGHPVPAYGDNSNGDAAGPTASEFGYYEDFSPDAMEYLEEAQGVFDEKESSVGGRRQWKSAFNRLVEQWEARSKYDEWGDDGEE